MNANAELHSQSNPPSSTTQNTLAEVTLAWASGTPLSSTETNSTLRFAPRKYPHTPEQIAKELRVDEEGNLWWRCSRKGRRNSKPVGAGTLTDYKNVRLDKHDYKAHTVIWCLYHNRWPLSGKVIDHINGIVTDNRKENLREVSNSDNMKNRKGLAAHNTTGVAGVCWVESRGRWLAHVKSNRKFISGGYHKSFEDAVLARQHLESKYGITGCTIDTSCTSPKLLDYISNISTGKTMKISELLKVNAASFKPPQKFPAGNYVVVIVSYDMLPFFWKKSNTHGLAFVPTIRPISCIEADDSDNPDLQQEQLSALEAYGDWTSREWQFAYTSRETNTKMAAVSEINFPLIECNETGDPIGILEKMAWRFYLRDNNGTEQGFVADVLGLSYPDGAELGTIMEDTLGKKFVASFGYEQNTKDPTRPPNLVIDSVTRA